MSPIKIPRLDSKLWARSISNCLKEKRKKEKSCPSVGSHPYLKVLFKTSYSILSLSQHPWLPTCWFNPQSPAPLLKLSKANPSPPPPNQGKSFISQGHSSLPQSVSYSFRNSSLPQTELIYDCYCPKQHSLGFYLCPLTTRQF